jgi:hypothetical protein
LAGNFSTIICKAPIKSLSRFVLKANLAMNICSLEKYLSTIPLHLLIP